MDGAPACPFVAFADDRDGRASSPDHRHRCFAETPPAPRALAHQEAYCLSSAFPVCPTFQEWARREAAQARADAQSAGAASAGAVGAAGADGAPDATAGAWGEPPAEVHTSAQSVPPDEPRRNPPRDWAAPPPWAGPAAGGGRPPGSTPPADELLAGKGIEGQGLAGSAADQLAGGPPPSPRPASTAAWSASTAGVVASGPDDDLAGLVGERPGAPASATKEGATTDGAVVAGAALAGAAAAGAAGTAGTGSASPSAGSSSRRPTVSSTRPAGPPGPAWERPRRYEAYPTIKTRAGLPGLPRLGLLAGALIIAAIALFMLPALLGLGGPGSSPQPSASRPAPSASTAPTAVPAPTPTVYVAKAGDTMSKIAKKFGVTLDDLIAANKDTIKNPDKLQIGDSVIIPLPASESASPAASRSTAP
jgi:LysM repeat protein